MLLCIGFLFQFLQSVGEWGLWGKYYKQNDEYFSQYNTNYSLNNKKHDITLQQSENIKGLKDETGNTLYFCQQFHEKSKTNSVLASQYFSSSLLCLWHSAPTSLVFADI